MGGIAQFTCCWAISLRLLSRASSGLPAPYRAWKRETYRATSIDRVADNTGLDTATNTAANATNTWQLLRLKRPLQLDFKVMLHWSTCNAYSQRMFFARICRHVTLLNRFQKLPTRCSTANIAKNCSQRGVTLERFFAQHRIVASWRCKLTSVTPPLLKNNLQTGNAIKVFPQSRAL